MFAPLVRIMNDNCKCYILIKCNGVKKELEENCTHILGGIFYEIVQLKFRNLTKEVIGDY